MSLKDLLKKYGVSDYGFVDFASLRTFEVRSASRIPADCRAAVAMIFPYFNSEAFKGNISAYCSVEDYHVVVGDLLKKICRADIISEVSAAIITEPPLSIVTLTNWAVPLNIISPESTDHKGPYPCFCISMPYPMPNTTKVTMIGDDVRNAAATSFFVIFLKSPSPVNAFFTNIRL